MNIMEENKTEEKKPEMSGSTEPMSQPSSPSEDSKVPGPKWLFYVLSFFIPLVGIIMGIVYMTKDNAEQKKFGKTLLTMGIVFGVVVPCICYAAYFGLIAGLGIFGESASNINYNYNSSYGY